ncbi:Crp/Fnr family transcriptional regulator [Aestuariispira insulae]|uniref:Cyclic nucleotide-binding domain-containing protein n=1 Tax=Aestuariispira insulae TaxID=1461337 RepID=A0A3D9H9H7_9PROT|nr:cyclic nucleotide-binding domain-containing protein [Aestuariispira insulae]RED46144.1 hypothetical protein DFP90_11053 [Aestuariispira insulae]
MAKPVMNRKIIPANSVIFHEGDVGNKAYLLKSGKVRITTTKEGEVVLLTTVMPNQLFGELALLDGSPRSATAIALEQCEVVIVRPEDIERQLDGVDEFMRYWVTYLTQRIKDLSKRVEQ